MGNGAEMVGDDSVVEKAVGGEEKKVPQPETLKANECDSIGNAPKASRWPWSVLTKNRNQKSEGTVTGIRRESIGASSTSSVPSMISAPLQFEADAPVVGDGDTTLHVLVSPKPGESSGNKELVECVHCDDAPSVMGTIVTIENATIATATEDVTRDHSLSMSKMSSLMGEMYCQSNAGGASTALKSSRSGVDGTTLGWSIDDLEENLARLHREEREVAHIKGCHDDSNSCDETGISSLTGGTSMFAPQQQPPPEGFDNVMDKFSDAFQESARYFGSRLALPFTTCAQCAETSGANANAVAPSPNDVGVPLHVSLDQIGAEQQQNDGGTNDDTAEKYAPAQDRLSTQVSI